MIVLDIAVQQVCLENSSNSYVRKGKISPECHKCYVTSVTELQTVVAIFRNCVGLSLHQLHVNFTMGFVLIQMIIIIYIF